MGVAALVLGIISIVFSFVPFLCFISLVTGLLSFIFGIVDLVNKGNQKYGMALTGIILAVFSVWICLFMGMVSFFIIDEYCYDDYMPDNKYRKYEDRYNYDVNKTYIDKYNNKYYI